MQTSNSYASELLSDDHFMGTLEYLEQAHANGDMYEAQAQAHDGCVYMVRWEVTDAKAECIEDACDWDNPCDISRISC